MTSKSDASRLADSFFAEAATDYIGLWQLARGVSCNSSSISEIAIMEQTLDLVRMLLQKGLVAGELTEEGGFLPWANQAPTNVLDRIQVEWKRLERPPDVGDICWFDRSKIEQTS